MLFSYLEATILPSADNYSIFKPQKKNVYTLDYEMWTLAC